MCGIFGILSLRENLDRDRHSLPNSTEPLKHRGPDDFGFFLDETVYLGHRRLSIIDLESGRQPVFNEDTSKCIIFNGEIYNFQDLRTELEEKGHRFSTHSDTEAIVHAYEEWGSDCVQRFRGMFAFAVWDTTNRTLFIARDRLGIKPLFYAVHNDTLYFASEMKAILQFSDFPRTIDPDGLASFFTLAYIPCPLTIFKGIHKFPPGHTMLVKKGDIRLRRYWDLHFEPDRSKSEAYFIEGFTSIFEEAVRLRLIADVPLGAFLSGGIDSGAVVAAMSRQSAVPVRTFSIGFGGNIGGYLDEREYARDVSRKFKTAHSEFEVRPDVRGIVGELVEAFDEPFADPGAIPSYYISKMARKEVTVALSGLGGDEMFGGYERYLGFKQSTIYNKLPLFVRENVIRRLVRNIPERANGHYTINHLKRFVRSAPLNEDLRYFGFLSMLDNGRERSLFSEPDRLAESFDHCRDMVVGCFTSPNAHEPLDKVFYCDIMTYLPEDILACTDRMSMWHGLEVRVPFLDHKLVEFCATIPHERKIHLWDKKHILKKAVTGILPEGVLNHRKQGFIGPMTYWLQTELKEYVLDVLSKKNLDRHGIFNKSTVKTILSEHFNRREINDKLIWSLVMFQGWYDKYME